MGEGINYCGGVYDLVASACEKLNNSEDKVGASFYIKAYSMEGQQYMRRALDLARLGAGYVSPNPMVGCVVVHNDRIIGEGYHMQYGQPHAEVNAIRSVADQSLLEESAVYVSLEPCSHYGKTPPCADLLVKKGVKKVVVCNLDPNPLVSGSGIAKLEQAGIQVSTGVLEVEGRHLNRRFFTSITKKRPYIILKWAKTSDGYVARANFDSKWISNPSSRQLVHKWRTEEDAILVGYRTALHDNPKLNVRDWTGRDPVRIYLDKYGSLPGDHLLKDGSVRTICITLEAQDHQHVSYQVVEGISPTTICQVAYQAGVSSLIVEGGSATLKTFIDEGMWDEARVFTSKTSFGVGIAAPYLHAKLASKENVMDDVLEIYQNG